MTREEEIRQAALKCSFDTDSSYYPIALNEVECWTELPKAPENKK